MKDFVRIFLCANVLIVSAVPDFFSYQKIFDALVTYLDSGEKSALTDQERAQIIATLRSLQNRVLTLDKKHDEAFHRVGYLELARDQFKMAFESETEKENRRSDIKRLEDRNQDLLARNQDLILDKQNLSALNKNFMITNEALITENKNMKKWYPTTINSVVYLAIGVVAFCFILDLYYTCYGGPPCEMAQKIRYKPTVTVIDPIEVPEETPII